MNYNLQKMRSVALMLMMLVLSLTTHAQDATPLAVEGVIRVKMKPELSAQVMELTSTDGSAVVTGVRPLDRLATTYNATSMKRVFRYSPKFEHKLRKHGLHLWYEVTYNNRAEVHSVAEVYNQLDEVEIAEPIYTPQLFAGKPVYLTNEEVEAKLKGRTDEHPFNDPYLPMQWHYNNTGQSGGTVGADINLYEAWKVATGSSDIIVSIHDQGVDWDHEDLVNNMWVNEAELNGDPMVDDDGNGYKDDIYGFNFAENKGAITPDYHGTHVAGTVGAMNNNGLGVSGVAGGTEAGGGVKMMSCQLFGGVSDGNTPDSYVYAANNGAVISQNSWGYSTPEMSNQAVLDAIDYFIEEAGDYPGSPMKGGLVIFASGNNDSDLDHWPGAYDKVVNVSALDAKNTKASYSNYHPSVDISAPGGETSDDGDMTDGQEQQGFSNGVLSTLNNNTYGYIDGTSMACPHVSGIAALVLSKYGGEDFTAEKLKQHILTGYVEIDHLPGNADYVGLLGKGAADAVIALVEDTKEGPYTTSDLAVAAITQEFAKLAWTVPADEHDGVAIAYEVLYSESEITEATLDYAKVRSFESKLAVGETVEFEVTELEALTTYYFRIYALDRWGNRSELSNEVSATTNSGPEAWIDDSQFSEHSTVVGWTPDNLPIKETTKYLAIDVDAQTSTDASNSFNLHNDGEGLLRWSVLQRHVKTSESIWASSAAQSLKANAPYVDYGQADMRVMNSNASNTMVPFASQDPDTGYKSYITPFAANLYYIGETDTTLTNSSATRFEVNEEDGFNLTNVDVFMGYASSEEKPAIFEVYKGYDISDAQLTYSQELTSLNINWNNFALEEQIYFENGEYFWLVLHTPSGILYPLGASTETNSEDSENCYISLNMGKTWALFEDMYYDNNIVWAVNAYSLFKTPGEYLTITPESDEVESGEFQEVTVSVDAATMVNGFYRSNVVIETNDPENPQLRAKAWLNVQGQKPIIKGEALVDFGSVILGSQKVIDVTVRNEGYGKFGWMWPNYSFSNGSGEFKSLDEQPSKILPQSEYTFKLMFKPESVGNISSKVTLMNDNGESFEFNVTGVCSEPPVMVINPSADVFDNVTIGDELSGSFSIENTGNYPLSYYLPSFSDGSIVGEINKEFCKFGYTSKDNLGGNSDVPAYEWIDISGSGTLIDDYSTEEQYFHYPVEISFDFPFFGERENSVYITNYGVLSFDTNSTFSKTPMLFKNEHQHDRFISAFGVIHRLTDGGEIYYEDLGDRFIVQYNNVIFKHLSYLTGMWEDLEITYQVVLHSDGNINFYYENLDAASDGGLDWTLHYSTFIAIEDKTKDDGLLVQEQQIYQLMFGTKMAIEFVNPGLGLVTEVSAPEGIVQPGESVQIDYKLATDELNVARHIENLPIISNDPYNNPGIFSMDINVTAGGESDLMVSHTDFDFGQVYQGDVKESKLWIINEGRANDEIVSAVFANDNFTLVGDVPVTLEPKRRMLYAIGVKSDAVGVYNDVLTITSANGEVFDINLSTEIIEAPEISTDITEISQTLAADKTASHTVTITNNGGNNLEVAPIGNDWLTFAEATVLANDVPEYTYTYTRSEDEGGPIYIWEEMYGTGTYAGDLDETTPWTEAIDLPFAFNYYGIDYNEFYIGVNGVISFTEYELGDIFGPTGTFPTPVEPNNILAPMFGYIGAAFFEETSGIYYDINSERAIIQWHKYIDGFYMADPISFQVILFPDGNIKYQYNMNDASNEALTNVSGIGLENADGTDGVTVGYGTYGSVGNETAIVFTPMERMVIEPGASKSFDVVLSSHNIYAGEYNFDLVLYNNTPNDGEYSIPVSLTVTGEAKTEYPTEVDFGIVQAYGEEFVKEFEIKNIGNKRMAITEVDYSQMSGSNVTAWLYRAGWFDSSWQWVQMSDFIEQDWDNGGVNIPIYLEPTESIRFKAVITPETADAINDNLVFKHDIPNVGDINIAVTALPELPPVMDLGASMVEVYAPSFDHKEDRVVKFGNTTGNSDLTYEMDLQFIRDLPAVQANSTAKVMESTTALPLANIDLEDAKLKSTYATQEDYNRVLEYETADKPDVALGYGGGLRFHAATAFTAPNDGFNLSHIQTWYIPGEWLESKIIVKVLTGSTMIQECQEVYRYEHTHTIESTDGIGTMITIELDEPQLFFPNEEFYLVIEYPTGATNPQGTVRVEENATDRFMFGDGDNWFDLTTAGYENHAWIIKACEEEYKVAVWAELASELTGSIAAGEEMDIELSFDAVYAEYGVNRADLTILTNDPYNNKVVVPISLNKNQGPLFNLGKEAFVSVNEGEVLEFDVIATDYEGDDFTLRMAETYENVTAEYEAGVLKFALTTGYEDAGIHTFSVVGEDEHANVSNFTINVDVVNTNRAPEVIQELETVMITLPKDNLVEIDLTTVFADADLTELTYKVITDLPAGFDVFQSNSTLLFTSSVVGNTMVTVQASDDEGAMAETTFELVAVMRTGIDDNDIDSQVSVYPIPVETELNIEWAQRASDDVVISVVDVAGSTVMVNELSAASTWSINLASLDAGVYFVEIQSGDETVVKKIIKK